jgi:hypothetical protein
MDARHLVPRLVDAPEPGQRHDYRKVRFVAQDGTRKALCRPARLGNKAIAHRLCAVKTFGRRRRTRKPAAQSQGKKN